jgi:hypothetical protein
LNAVTVTNEGGYSLVVANTAGSITSTVAQLTLVYPPVLTTTLSNRIALVGGTLGVSVSAAGSGPLAFQWFQNGRPLVGQTSSNLVVPNVTTRANGQYQVEIRNSAGTIRSGSFSVVAVIPPTIVRSPRSLNVIAGRKATFKVSVKGTKPLTFQWLKDGIPIPNATAKAFSISTVQPTDAGTYSVRVSNIGATRESAAVRLTTQP